MIKYWIFILVFIAFAVASATGIIVHWNRSGESLSFYGMPTRAQELNPDRIPALMTHGSIVNDAVAERPIIGTSDSDQIRVRVTAYTSDPYETDSTPTITALGTKTRDGVAAANFLPFGTKFRIPEFYGDKVFTIEDRLNARFNNQRIVDIWMSGKKEAVNFGKKVLILELF